MVAVITSRKKKGLKCHVSVFIKCGVVVMILLYGALNHAQFNLPEQHIIVVPSWTWTSPHLFDCRKIPMQTEENYFFVTTKTNPPFQMSIHNPNEDIGVSLSIKKDGCWECNHIQKMLDALSSHYDSYFLDVGGNIGMWTLAAAAAKKQTFTIEPSEENYKRICETVNKNSFHDQVNLMTIAATTKPEVFHLNIPMKNKGGTSLIKVTADDTNNAQSERDDSNTIMGHPIDSLNLPRNRPVVMKVDVEGHELQALLGALEFLQESQIVYVMMELRPFDLRQNEAEWSKVFNVLSSSKGLVPFRIDYDGEVELNPNDLSEWKHHKHPKVLYFDVVWKEKE